MILFPPAKINLGLRVLYKRPDNYHEIDTCMVPIPFFDVLELLPADEFKFLQTGLTVEGDLEQNLCVKAYRLMEQHFHIPPVYMHLRKEIPMGAGLGGGSADAAYVLRGLRDIFVHEIGNEKLEELAAQLGSDCPLFIEDGARMASGRGEILTPIEIDLKGYFLKIVNPGIHIGTAEAYSGIEFPFEPESVRSVVSAPIQEWKNRLFNDFEKNAFIRHPELSEIKEKLYAEGSIYAAMSGSGSTMFGIYEKEPVRSFLSSDYLEKILLL